MKEVGEYKEFVFLLLFSSVASVGRIKRPCAAISSFSGKMDRQQEEAKGEARAAARGGKDAGRISSRRAAVSSIWRQGEKKKAKGTRDERETKQRNTSSSSNGSSGARTHERNIPPNAEGKIAAGENVRSFSARDVQRRREREIRLDEDEKGRRGDSGMRCLGSLKLSSARKISLFAMAG